MERNDCYIYGLVDPRDGIIRYVGCTQDIEVRFKQHIENLSGGTDKRAWIADLIAQGTLPELCILETTPYPTRRQIEIKWILRYRDTVFNCRKPASSTESAAYRSEIALQWLRASAQRLASMQDESVFQEVAELASNGDLPDDTDFIKLSQIVMEYELSLGYKV